MKSYVLLGSLLLLLVGFAPAEAQQTLCLRMGNMIQCDTPAPPSSSYGNVNLGDFADTYLRAQEQATRAQESAARTEWLRQQTELLRRQNAPPTATPPAQPAEDLAASRRAREAEDLDTALARMDRLLAPARKHPVTP
jgi:hypothetical protein